MALPPLRLLLSLLVLVGAALPILPARAAAGRLFIQAQRLEIASGGSVAVRLRRANAAGNLIVAYVVWDNGDPVVLSDSEGNAYESAVGPTQGQDGTRAQIFFASNVTGGVNTVTATFASPISTHATLYVHEYAGVARLVPFDAASAATGESATLDTAPLNTRNSRELLFMAVACNGRGVKRTSRGYHARARRRCELTADAIAATAGPYEASALQSGTSWIAQLAAFEYSGSAPPSPKYPVKVSATGRYLVDQSEAPFLITGDSPQALMVDLSESQADAFFADRAKHGFNTVWINLLCGTYTGGRPDGSTYDGIVPFTNDFDLATPNEAYFARMDDMIRLAGRHGLLVILDPAETGSFLSVLEANGVDGSYAYGRYLGNRYRSFDNILWMSGNDFDTFASDPGSDPVVQAVAQGIQSVDQRHIHTAELTSSTLNDPSWAPIIQLNASYTYNPTYAQVLTDYDRPGALPTFMVEANYEFENQAAGERTPNILRRQAYWSLLSGAAGQLYGNHYTWPFLRGWQKFLDSPGAIEMAYVPRLFAPRRWYDLVPDQTHQLVTTGYGAFSTTDPVGTNDYVTAAKTPDGALAMAYLPTMPAGGTITVDMTQLAGPAFASWYDPSRGRSSPVAGSPLDNSDPARVFAPPGKNGDGDDDWVLVLETTPPN
jgi:hypothetical protein